jgi:hypothetical protein
LHNISFAFLFAKVAKRKSSNQKVHFAAKSRADSPKHGRRKIGTKKLLLCHLYFFCPIFAAFFEVALHRAGQGFVNFVQHLKGEGCYNLRIGNF